MGLFSSKSSTRRTYQTTNQSQQGEANVIGSGNAVNVYRADALTLDNIARMHGDSLSDLIRESGSAREDALMFAGESMVEMREAMAESQEAGYSFAGEASNRAFDLIDSDRGDTFAFLGEAFQSAMDANADNSDRLQELARQTAGNLMQNTEHAIGQVADANESDNLEYMKLMLLATAALVGFIAWRGK